MDPMRQLSEGTDHSADENEPITALAREGLATDEQGPELQQW